MTNIHVFPDEKLGGVLREYVEVDRAANVGDKIVIVNPSTFQFGDDYTQGTIMTVVKAYEDGDVYCEKFDIINKYEYQTLEPTSIVHIDGVRYRMVGRNAKVGEKVIVVEANGSLVYRNVGEVVEIIKTDGSSFGGLLNPHDFGEKGAIYHFQYLVLEPIDDESPKTTEDLIANLARRVAELEKRVKIIDVYNDELIDRMNDAEEKIERALDDIVDLEERTQPLEALVKAVKSGE
ncbi:hypothetical protein ACTHHL_04450 [Aeribacillus composti]|uniref:hypothetical protein n=1 Tax=Aeribacillus composti TaxID=1868734 RepID=UPI00406A3768